MRRYSEVLEDCLRVADAFKGGRANWIALAHARGRAWDEWRDKDHLAVFRACWWPWGHGDPPRSPSADTDD